MSSARPDPLRCRTPFSVRTPTGPRTVSLSLSLSTDASVTDLGDPLTKIARHGPEPVQVLLFLCQVCSFWQWTDALASAPGGAPGIPALGPQPGWHGAALPPTRPLHRFFRAKEWSVVR